MVVANNSRIIIIIYFRDLPPTASAGGWTDKEKVPSRSTIAIINGGIYLVAGFPVVAIGTSMVAGKVASMGPAILIGLELSS